MVFLRGSINSKWQTKIDGGIMKGQLLKELIQDVPEEYSVCEFECRQPICTAQDHAECELCQQAPKRTHGIRQYNVRINGKQPNTEWLPVWLYEAMPIICVLAGFTISYI